MYQENVSKNGDTLGYSLVYMYQENVSKNGDTLGYSLVYMYQGNVSKNGGDVRMFSSLHVSAERK